MSYSVPLITVNIHVLYRCQSLKDEIRRLKEKEAADTKALEDIVQKVEKNLLVTTVSVSYTQERDQCHVFLQERAVKAESTIMKLQQEIKALQVNMATVGFVNQILDSHS